MLSFTDLQLLPALQKALEENHYQTPTPIQQQAIPTLLNHQDLLGIAQTGTGKTAAFSLPLLQNLLSNPVKRRPGMPQALILVPTRELAVQVQSSLSSYGRHTHLKTLAIFGGVRIFGQTRALQQGVDILVATPGRLMDHLEQQHLTLASVRFLVLDEADRMLDMGFLPTIRNLIRQLPKERQTMLFSATMPAPIVQLTGDLLRDPVRVEVTPESTPVERIDQRLYFVPREHKRDLLHNLLSDNAVTRSLVFTRTKVGAQRLALMLQKKGITADAIHGNRTQSARQKALKNFSRGRLQVLVATDVASRGIDIDQVSHVFNFELPDEPESYVHRIGRTARGGAEGIAVSLCSPEERSKLKAIERTLRQKLPIQEWDKSQVRGAASEGKLAAPKPASQEGRGAGKRPRPAHLKAVHGAEAPVSETFGELSPEPRPRRRKQRTLWQKDSLSAQRHRKKSAPPKDTGNRPPRAPKAA
ncbi:MAG: DEAD/DEAH box helicase [bacterium]|jgi:ATP-dependent RNA helicase RhlE